MTILYLDKDGVDELVEKMKQLVSAGGGGDAFTQASDGMRIMYAADDSCLYFEGEDGIGVEADPFTSKISIGVDGFAASAVTSGTFASARIPNLAASKITSGQLALARGGTGADASSVPQNQVFAAPYGQDGAASFRVLHSSDIPQLDATKVGIQTGTVAASSIASANGASSTVTFTPPFSGTPVVLVGLTGTQTEATGACSAYAMNITSTGFTLRRQNNGASARNLGAQWIAIGTFTTS